MSKSQIVEWLVKRISTKADDLRVADTTELAETLADDIDSYLGILKELIKESINPF